MALIEFLQRVQSHRTCMQHKWIHCSLKQKTIPDQQKTERQQKRKRRDNKNRALVLKCDTTATANSKKKKIHYFCTHMEDADHRLLTNILVWKLKHRAFSQDLHVICICAASVRFKMYSYSRQELIVENGYLPEA